MSSNKKIMLYKYINYNSKNPGFCCFIHFHPLYLSSHFSHLCRAHEPKTDGNMNWKGREQNVFIWISTPC